jgi:hypothetical protein
MSLPPLAGFMEPASCGGFASSEMHVLEEGEGDAASLLMDTAGSTMGDQDQHHLHTDNMNIFGS